MKVLFSLGIFLFAGCAAIERNEIHQQSLWLEKAGFRAAKSGSPPTATPGRSQMVFQEIPQENGRMIYTFTDPVNGLVYRGGGKELAAYREISTAARSRRSANLAQITPSGSRVTGPLVW